MSESRPANVLTARKGGYQEPICDALLEKISGIANRTPIKARIQIIVMMTGRPFAAAEGDALMSW
jgi:hypothetical protein